MQEALRDSVVALGMTDVRRFFHWYVAPSWIQEFFFLELVLAWVLNDVAEILEDGKLRNNRGRNNKRRKTSPQWKHQSVVLSGSS